MRSIAIIADDLTGASDTGIQFRKHGLKTKVVVDANKLDLFLESDEVLAINSNTRPLKYYNAYRKVYEISCILKKAFYASCKMVSHANIRLVDFDCSVNIFGTKIYPGDIIFCDQYGALIIPEGTLYYLVEACRKIAAAELPVIQNCKAVILNGKKAKAQNLVLWRKQMEQLRLELKEEIKSLN